MWHFISEQISQHIQQEFICDDIREVTSGDTHKAFRISDGRKRFFCKINRHTSVALFESEIEGLIHLAQTKLFRVPHVICSGIVGENSFLVLEYISMSQGDQQSWMLYGEQLAHMHQQNTQAMYGWQADNFIGPTIQPNTWTKKWSQFFAEQRIGFLLQLLAEKGHKFGKIERIVSSVQTLLSGHSPVSSMLHGDLWIGNTGFFKGQPVLFDPAFYFGDRETDIAMTELFNKFPTAFYQGYESIWPLDVNYQYRKAIYQLYHILNHALLFGGQYVQTAKATLTNLDS